MCVIIVCPQDEYPDTKTLEACERQNPQGAGVAWQEKDLVKYEKGLDLKEVEVILDRVKPPVILHFRIASVGSQSKCLNHPFPLGAQSQGLLGESKHGVLFHNGTWNDWRHDVKQSIIATRTKIPDGEWSDSRAMAFLAGIYGINILEFIDEKIAVMTPAGWSLYGRGWIKKENIYYSNDYWDRRPWTGNVTGGRGSHGSWPEDNWRHEIPKTTLPGDVTLCDDIGVCTETDARRKIGERLGKDDPDKCDHSKGAYWMKHYRFCQRCAIRLLPSANFPFTSPTATITVGANADLTKPCDVSTVAVGGRQLTLADMTPAERREMHRKAADARIRRITGIVEVETRH